MDLEIFTKAALIQTEIINFKLTSKMHAEHNEILHSITRDMYS